MQLRSGKPSGGPSAERAASGSLNPSTPVKAEPKTSASLEDYLSRLPHEITHQILDKLDDPRDLVALALANSRFDGIVEDSEKWATLFERRFCVETGGATHVQRRAAALAKSWRRLYRARHLAQLDLDNWERASIFEVQASIEQMLMGHVEGGAAAAAAAPPEDTCVIFLVDGSGSVNDEDFATMTEFMLTAAEQAAAGGAGGAGGSAAAAVRMAVVQFSNEVRVELPPTAVGGPGAAAASAAAFSAAVASIERMNGGTNVAGAVRAAGQILKAAAPGPAARRVVALLTDGRIDQFQAREARDMAARLGDELGGVALFAFGVGRGVDRQELLRIVGGSCSEGEAAGRYLPLMVLNDGGLW